MLLPAGMKRRCDPSSCWSVGRDPRRGGGGAVNTDCYITAHSSRQKKHDELLFIHSCESDKLVEGLSLDEGKEGELQGI
jgi:hypothetical protein